MSGAIAAINTHSLSVGNYCTQKDTSEDWLTTTDTSNNYWVEEGLLAGVHYDGSCGNGVQFFWADERPNGGGFNEHFPGGSAAFNSAYSFKLLFDQNSIYEIDRNGSTIGWSNGSPCCGDVVQAGGEAHQDTTTISGEASSLQKQINQSTWSYGWTGAFVVNTNGFFTMSGTPSSDELYSH